MLDFFSLIKSLIHWQSIETGFIVKIAEKFIENGLLAQVGTILNDSDGENVQVFQNCTNL